MAQAGVAYRGAKQRNAARARQNRAALINRRMLRLTLALIAVCLFAYIGRMTVISAGAKQISEIRQEITQLRESQQYLEVHLAARQDLNRVRDEALGRLGMRNPSDGEVYLISLSGYVSAANTQTAHDSTMP